MRMEDKMKGIIGDFSTRVDGSISEASRNETFKF
jgi:hypothetical protein